MTKRVTLKQVAARAGVSYQTVSKVLNKRAKVSKETEDRIRTAASELDYRPNQIARSLRSQRSRLIGYSWAPSPPDQGNPILDPFMQSMMRAAKDAGHYLLCFPSDPGRRQNDAYQELLATNRVDGFIISGVEYNDSRVGFLQEREFPFVAFGRTNGSGVFPYVDLDGAAGMRKVAEHLVAQGHRRIGVLAWAEDSRVGQNRMDGLQEGLHQAGIDLLPEWVRRGEGRFNFGYEAAQQLLELPGDRRPSAIVGFNDAMAIGAMHAAQQRGFQVGHNFSITGFDDSPLVQYMAPPLTSVRHPVWQMGRQAVAMLVQILDGQPLEQPHMLFEPELIVRRSSMYSQG